MTSLSIATNIPYSVVYNRLYRLQGFWVDKNNFAKCPILDGIWEQVFVSYLNRYYQNYLKAKVDNWADIPKNGTFIFYLDKHMSCVIDGVINDTWIPLSNTPKYLIEIKERCRIKCTLCECETKLYFMCESDLPRTCEEIEFNNGKWFCSGCLNDLGKTFQDYISPMNIYDYGNKKEEI